MGRFYSTHSIFINDGINLYFIKHFNNELEITVFLTCLVESHKKKGQHLYAESFYKLHYIVVEKFQIRD